MSGSRLFLKISMCVCLFVGTISFSGCEKVPTWGELTGDEKEETVRAKPQAKPSKPDKPVKVKPKPKPKPVEVVVEPEEALATFQNIDSRQIRDTTIEKLARDMGDKIGLVDELNLTQSKISVDSFRHISKFSGLLALNVTKVRLDDETIELIGQMTQLETLILNNVNNINSDTLMFLDNLTNLKKLSMNHTDIKDEAFEALLNLDNLEELEFSGINISGKGFYECRKKKALKNLKYINANNTFFGRYGFAGVQGLSSLEVLLVRNAHVTDPSLGGLKGMKNLKKLDIGYNKITAFGVQEIVKTKPLETLSLHTIERVTDRGLKLIVKLKNLESLTLSGTKCSPGGIAAFKKKRKDCVVYYNGKTL